MRAFTCLYALRIEASDKDNETCVAVRNRWDASGNGDSSASPACEGSQQFPGMLVSFPDASRPVAFTGDPVRMSSYEHDFKVVCRPREHQMCVNGPGPLDDARCLATINRTLLCNELNCLVL